MQTADPNVLKADVYYEDQLNEWGLYLVPDKAQESFITEDELREALRLIEESK